MPKVKVDDIELYYELHGEGIPLVMIMGLGRSSGSWGSEFIGKLSKFHRVIIYDNRGTGRSDKPDIEYSMGMMADDIAGLMDVINVPRAHVLGISMGGMIAQELALNRPEKVLGLILCSTSCGGPDRAQKRAELSAQLLTLMNPPPGLSREEALKHQWGMMYTQRYVQENMEALMKDAAKPSEYPTPPFVWRRQAQAGLNFYTYDRLPSIRVPTMVLGGEEDIMTLPENFRILADNIPGAQLRLFKDAAHGFLWEVMDQAVRAILDFLAGVS